MTKTHAIQFFDADGSVMETAFYVCSLDAALSAASERADEIGAEDYDFAPRVGDEDVAKQEAA
jgi:hypothetical protein